ncbi:MAG TPA: DUF885 domain-containing protein [Verrucomicrobiae bacterium]|nr:DUF885 domain-containing protein [Verrucomicrobiae bacterium]
MKQLSRFLLFSFLAGFLAATCLAEQTQYEAACDKLASQSGKDTERLHALFKLDWDHSMVESPEYATEVGYPGENNRWTDESLAAIERRKQELRAPLKVLESIDRKKLSARDQLNYDLFRRNTTEAIEGSRFKGEYLPITQLNGVQQDPAQILDIAPRGTVQDYDDMISRLRGLPALIDQTIVLLKKGLEAGITPPRITLRDVPQQIKSQMEPKPDANPLLKAFQEFPSIIPTGDRARLRREAQAALQSDVIPAYAKLYDFFTKTYLPHARESIGMNDLPDGKAWYAFNVRTITTTTLSPKQIHEIGLSEVKRIRSEMDAVIRETGFKGNFSEFSEFLRTDPRFYYTNADDLLEHYRDIAKRIDPQLAHLFGKLPRLPYGVRAVPAYSAKSQPTAYYQPGSPEAGRPGWFTANTYALDTRPKWEMEALTMHEAVPGHHLQIALAQEMEDEPEFRKNAQYTAFVEGWGLYSETLGSEMGFYKDPYMKFGQLTYEIWRAIRLVVDTGIHSMGWTRQQAIDYFLANSSKTEHDVTVEVDRYIVWPGQALAYKIGQMKIRQLRDYATKELGSKFDIREFHDHVLANGALPLDILENQIKSWVAAKKTAP